MAKRGNPAFKRGVPNPYMKGRKGKKEGDQAKEIPNSLSDTPQNQGETSQIERGRQ